jgi:polar amino acid transport system permease protein
VNVPLAVNFEWDVFIDRIVHPDAVFARAMVTTIVIAVVAQLLGTALGLVAALARLSRIWPLRALAYAYVLIIRGTPLIVQIFFVYYGSNLFLGFELFPSTVSLPGYTVDGAIVAGIAALAINEGGYMAEIIRAGILSIHRGQAEAAKSLGMRPRLTMRRIILPQAARVMIPPFGNEFNSMLKSTSLLFFIGVYEMFADAQVHYAATFLPAEYFGAVALWYLLLTTVWSGIQYLIERRLSVSVVEEAPRRSGRQLTTQSWDWLRGTR